MFYYVVQSTKSLGIKCSIIMPSLRLLEATSSLNWEVNGEPTHRDGSAKQGGSITSVFVAELPTMGVKDMQIHVHKITSSRYSNYRSYS